ncbi:MAG: outer membrane beta-barrel protein [Prevotella sp.]|nr:outer membrane beta-barrel protein [Prevotella sp.]
MKKQDFESQLRQQMEGYEVAPPDGLWEAVERRTAAADGKRATTVALRRWWAVAASLLLLIGAGTWLLHQNERTSVQEILSVNGNPQSQKTAYAEGNPQSSSSISRSVEGDLQSVEGDLQSPTNTSRNAEGDLQSPTNTSHNAEGDLQSPTAEQEDLQSPNTAYAEGNPQSPSIISRSPLPAPRSSQSVQGDYRSSKPSQSPHLMASVYYGSEMMGETATANPVYMSQAMLANFSSAEYYANEATRAEENVVLAGYEEKKEYAAPVKLGLLVAVPLTGRWGLQTGLSYMRHRTFSSQKTTSATIHDRRTYHYMGIPLQATYQLVRSSWGGIYALAGGEADFNVKARGEMDGHDYSPQHDRLQLSATLGAGFQYTPLPQIALYAEPQIAYYFDNGSAVDTRMKDQPLNFSLQFGLKYIFR